MCALAGSPVCSSEMVCSLPTHSHNAADAIALSVGVQEKCTSVKAHNLQCRAQLCTSLRVGLGFIFSQRKNSGRELLVLSPIQTARPQTTHSPSTDDKPTQSGKKKKMVGCFTYQSDSSCLCYQFQSKL